MLSFFDNDEVGYRGWLTGHPAGFVLNRRRRQSPDYLVLHRATCWTISTYSKAAHGDAFTGRGYVKVCAVDIESLKGYAKNECGRPDGSFSSECVICRPLG